jgi:hypothetical protein
MPNFTQTLWSIEIVITKEELLNQIEAAFQGVKLEDGIGLSEANAIDDYEDAAFRKKCRSNDEKNDWKIIHSNHLNSNYCSLSYFDAKGMRFHIPAFMIADLKGEYEFGIVFTLTNISDYSKSQFSLLTIEQRFAIKSYLIYLSKNPNYEYERNLINEAVNGYWA